MKLIGRRWRKEKVDVRETRESVKELYFISSFFSRYGSPSLLRISVLNTFWWGLFVHLPLCFFASSVEIIWGVYPHFSEKAILLFASVSSLSSVLQGILKVNLSSWIWMKTQVNVLLLPFKPTLFKMINNFKEFLPTSSSLTPRVPVPLFGPWNWIKMLS